MAPKKTPAVQKQDTDPRRPNAIIKLQDAKTQFPRPSGSVDLYNFAAMICTFYGIVKVKRLAALAAVFFCFLAWLHDRSAKNSRNTSQSSRTFVMIGVIMTYMNAKIASKVAQNVTAST